MDREFKLALSLVAALAALSVFLLGNLAGVGIFSREFVRGFVPFFLLLVPFILQSTEIWVAVLRRWSEPSRARKLVLPAYIALVYILSSFLNDNFSVPLFGKLAAWILVPSLLLVFATRLFPPYIAESAAALALWLPLEFGELSGFDIIFTPGIQIPAQPFAAVVLGYTCFAVLRGLPDIGYTFRWQWKDMGKVAVALPVLALVLVPAGTWSGFIGRSPGPTSPLEAVKLLLGIYFLVAIPEELLFRGLIQNLLSKLWAGRPRGSAEALAAASLIFGFSHWNNFNPPDWRYVALATVAGALYSWTSNRTAKTTVSALVHCGVNFIWAVLFKG